MKALFISLALCLFAASASACPNLSGHYVLQGEDGAVEHDDDRLTGHFLFPVPPTPGLMAKQDTSSLEAGKTAPTAHAPPPHRIHAKEDVEKEKLIHTVSPMYPPLTGKRVDGTVVLHVLIGKDGAVKSAKYVSGPETCGWYAIKAVLQWRYEPTLMNGVPVEVDTTVSVVFPPPGISGYRRRRKTGPLWRQTVHR
jgi:hypothetical protein